MCGREVRVFLSLSDIGKCKYSNPCRKTEVEEKTKHIQIWRFETPVMLQGIVVYFRVLQMKYGN